MQRVVLVGQSLQQSRGDAEGDAHDREAEDN